VGVDACAHTHVLIWTGGWVQIWDVKQKRNVQTLKGHNFPVTYIKHSPDGRWVVSGDAAGYLRIWDLTASKLLQEVVMGNGAAISAGAAVAAGGNVDEITGIDFHPMQLWLAVAGGSGENRRVAFWDLEEAGQENHKIPNIANTAREAAKYRSIMFHKGYLFSATPETLKVLVRRCVCVCVYELTPSTALRRCGVGTRFNATRRLMLGTYPPVLPAFSSDSRSSPSLLFPVGIIWQIWPFLATTCLACRFTNPPSQCIASTYPYASLPALSGRQRILTHRSPSLCLPLCV
jgi:hypothetical protein